MNNPNATTPFDDMTVDNLQDGQSGVIDQVSTLAFDIPENTLINNLDRRIEDSRKYWDSPKGFDLKRVRSDNLRLYLGKHIDVSKLYRYQTPYVENQIYIGEQAVIAYLTAQNPQPEVYPAQDTPRSKIFAGDLEKAMKAHSDKFQIGELLGNAVRGALNKRVGLVKLWFDPAHGKNGEIVPEVIDPEHVIIDKNAKQSANPAFICIMLKMSVNEILSRWPKSRDEVFKELGIVRGTYNQMEQTVHVREVWFTYYDKAYKAQEGLVYYFGNTILEKTKNPNFLYASPDKNLLSMPPKPFIPLNFDNDGNHWIDYTGPIEQAAPMQEVLNKRGRQLMEIVDKANGLTIFSSDSGLTKDDLQNITGDPNQRLIIKTSGQRVEDLAYRLDPPVIPPMLQQDKIDLRTQVHAIIGTPSEFTGVSDGGNDDETLGQSQMKKDQASGRQDLYVRSIDRFLARYFNLLAQMMVVWYDEKHMFVYNGGDGEFDYITMHRDLIEDGMIVTVKSGSTPPFNKSRQEAVALALAKMGLASPLDIYKLLSLPNAQQLYDNWAKYKSDPIALARTALDEVDDNKAYIAFTEVMAGKDPDDVDNPSIEFVLSLRKLMINDEFIKAPKNRQSAFLKYVEKAVKSLEIRTALDEASKQGPEALDPSNPLQPPTAQPQMGVGAPPMPSDLGQPPTAAPTMPPSPMGGMPASPLAGMPPQGMGAPMPPQMPPQTPQSPPAGILPPM